MSTETTEAIESSGSAHRSGIVIVWALALLASIAIGVFSPGQQSWVWLALSFAGCVIAALVIQLATREKHGFVNRLAASVVGAFLIFLIATIVFSLIQLAT